MVKAKPKTMNIREKFEYNFYPKRNYGFRQTAHQSPYFIRASSRGNYYSHRSYPHNSSRYSNSRRQVNKEPSRPTSPIEGSEEFIARKIKQTSAIIMRQLLSPDEPIVSSNKVTVINKEIDEIHNDSTLPKESKEKQNERTLVSSSKSKNTNAINVKEIHEKIMSHISKLNDGKKKNLINAHSSGYDIAIQQIQKQKRLELSRVLRDMCSSLNNPQKSGELINSIIPDIGIKIEELPIDVIEELRKTLNLDLEQVSDTNNFDAKSYISISSEDLDINTEAVEIKKEQIETEGSENTGSIEIKPEDIQEFETVGGSENVETSHNLESQLSLHTTITIKDERQEDFSEEPPANTLERNDSCNSNFSKETMCLSDIPERFTHQNIREQYNCPNTDSGNVSLGSENENLMEHSSQMSVTNLNSNNLDNRCFKEMSCQTEDSLNLPSNFIEYNMEYFIKKFTENYRCDISNLKEVSYKIFFIEKSVKELTDFRQSLFKAHCYSIQDLNRNKETVDISGNNLSNGHNIENSLELSNINAETSKIQNNSEDIGINQNESMLFKAPDSSVQQLSKNKESTNIHKNNLSYSHINNSVEQSKTNTEASITQSMSQDKRIAKKRKRSTFENNGSEPVNNKNEEEKLLVLEKILDLPKIKEKVLVIQRVDNELIVATETGKLIYISLKDGSSLHTLDVTSVPITSVVIYRGVNNFIYMYIGSVDHVLKVYNFKKKELIKASPIEDSIQCMDTMWDYIFMGCDKGMLLRYSIKKEKVEWTLKSSYGIMVIKAAQEGPRKVLLIGHRHAPIYVLDAFSGLHLRNFSNEAISMTVYSLIIERNFIYCGTPNNSILVFSFNEGTLKGNMFEQTWKGISCMKICMNLLFAACFNGSIYVYNMEMKRRVGILKGPGGAILSMEVLNNQVIVGTILRQFESIIIPDHILSFS